MIPTSIDGTDITGATIDGTDVQEITVDGQTVFTAAPNIPDGENIHARYIVDEEPLSDQDSITTFSDQSLNGHDLTGGSPTYVADEWNGKAVARFDGSSDQLDGDIADITQPFTVAQVLQFSGSSTSILTSHSGDNGNAGIIRHRGDNSDGLQTRSGNNLSTGGAFGFTSRVVIIAVFDGSNSLIEVNDVQEALGDVGTNGLTRINIGNRDDSISQFFEGDLAESIVWDSRLDDTQRTDAFGYFDSEYAVS